MLNVGLCRLPQALTTELHVVSDDEAEWQPDWRSSDSEGLHLLAKHPCSPIVGCSRPEQLSDCEVIVAVLNLLQVMSNHKLFYSQQMSRRGSGASGGGSRASWCCQARSRRSSTCAILRADSGAGALRSRVRGRCRPAAAAEASISSWQSPTDHLRHLLGPPMAAHHSPCSGHPRGTSRCDVLAFC